MTDRLPSLDWVRTFEIAARTKSFVAAADALSVSPGAVSRTIKELERHLGVKLFERLKRGISLTDAGREYAQSVAPAILQISEASLRLTRKSVVDLLRVTTMPALAERWLVPRLGDFQKKHPNISVEFSADAAVVDLPNSSFDIALRYGSGRFGYLDCVKLFDDELFPVAAPALLERTPVTRYSDLFAFTALQDKSWASDWKLWFDAAGVVAPRSWQFTSFTLYSMALSAAVAGQGVIIGHKGIVEDELRKGTLVEPFDLRVKSSNGFYLVRNPSRPASPWVDAFVDWIVELAGQHRTGR
jgi:LysR family glycine cleavage system transcriptional activator